MATLTAPRGPAQKMGPQRFHRGDVADAGEAVAGWSLNVDDLFMSDVR